MVLFDVGQRIYNEGRIGIVIDTFVGEDGNTRYVVKFESNNPKVIEVVENFLAKDLELVEGVLMYAKPYVDSKIEELKERVEKLNKRPKLVIIRVEGDKASERYVRNKNKMCDEIGILNETILLPNDVTQEEVKDKIMELNNDVECSGVLLQLPLPKHLDEKYLLDQICPYLDVDCLSSWNIGKLLKGEEYVQSCTPKGIVGLLKFYGVDLKGKDVLIVNDSTIVGRPLALLMLKEKATPTIAHIETKNLKDKIKRADIVVLATSNANFVGADDFVKGQVIVDVSINVGADGKLCGDVVKSDYNKLLKKGCLITPVPLGIGQTTVLSLMENVIEIAEKREEN